MIEQYHRVGLCDQPFSRQVMIRDEVNGMIECNEAGTKTEAFQKMVEFYSSIGIGIKEATVKSKYFRAEEVKTNPQLT